MGFLRKNLGIGPKYGLAKNKYEETIQHIYDNLENIIDFYKKLRIFYQDIDIIKCNGNWEKTVNDLYKKYGINREYVESENRERRIKLEIFIEKLPETPTIFDIKYLFKESLTKELEWVCPFSIDGELIEDKLKTYYPIIKDSENFYKKYFEDTK